jgi:DNA-binding NtrC family response regulator
MKKDERILIVDGDRDFANELTNYLLAEGYRNVESLDDYPNALIRMRQNRFDIVLMDVFAPRMKGFEYVQEIKHIKPEIRAFLMIEPGQQHVVNGKTRGDIGFDCLMKSTITQDLVKHLRG